MWTMDNGDDTPGKHEFVIREVHESGLVCSLRVASENECCSLFIHFRSNIAILRRL